jgi:hypothetical protein
MIVQRDAATEMVDHMFRHFQRRVNVGTTDCITTQSVVGTIGNLRVTREDTTSSLSAAVIAKKHRPLQTNLKHKSPAPLEHDPITFHKFRITIFISVLGSFFWLGGPNRYDGFNCHCHR